MDETYHSPQYLNFKKLCKDLKLGKISTVIKVNTGLDGWCYSDLKNKGIIPPLESKMESADEDTSKFRTIVEQAGVPARKLEPAIQYGITAYMLQQTKQLGLDDVEYDCLLSGLGIRKKQWNSWVEGIESVPPEILHDIAKHFGVPVSEFTNYASLRKSIRDEIFKNYLSKAFKSTIEQALVKDEDAIIINHNGNIQILSGSSEEIEGVIKSSKIQKLKDFAEYIKTDEYKAKEEKRINLKDTLPY